MGNTRKRVCKITDITWVKYTHFRKQTAEDLKLKGCVVDEVTQQMGHAKITLFNACNTDMNQKMLHACSGFDVQK